MKIEINLHEDITKYVDFCIETMKTNLDWVLEQIEGGRPDRSAQSWTKWLDSVNHDWMEKALGGISFAFNWLDGFDETEDRLLSDKVIDAYFHWRDVAPEMIREAEEKTGLK